MGQRAADGSAWTQKHGIKKDWMTPERIPVKGAYTKEDLAKYENVWDEPGYNAENTIAVHIRKIREKIEINPRDPRYLKVVWGIGYKIEA